ncbi:MAG: hypothetical protein ACKV2V_10235 [Blastocatellia bacterium]
MNSRLPSEPEKTDLLLRDLASDLLRLDPEEFLAAAAADGLDTDTDIAACRGIIDTAIAEARMTPVHRARERNRRDLARVHAAGIKMPVTAAGRRDMLLARLGAEPSAGAARVTAHYRDLHDLPDEDIAVMLRNLLYLEEIADGRHNDDDSSDF